MLPCELIPKLSDMPQFYGVALGTHRTDHTYPKKGMRAHIAVKVQLGVRRYWTGKRADAGDDPPVPMRMLHPPKPLICKVRTAAAPQLRRCHSASYRCEKTNRCLR